MSPPEDEEEPWGDRLFGYPYPRVPEHFVSASCEGEKCYCGRPATHKVGEEIASDDPWQVRHNFTQYVCCLEFRSIFGPAVLCPIE